MATNIPQLAPNIRHILHNIAVKLTVEDEVITFSSFPYPVTIFGQTYEGLGSLLSVTEMPDSLAQNNADIQIGISGITQNPSNMALVLGTQIKGSVIEIYRVFGNPPTLAPTTSPLVPIFLRYKGFITGFTINEDSSLADRTRTFTITLNSSSINSILESRVTGRRTNDRDHRRFYPNDPSMSRVAILNNSVFDFGKTLTGK